ncbi:unnamed protein product [Hydatigera taeniaeformis]|uniref:Anaphase-promoting complex subunit 1 n=1 Tax=Hydatigena taeniaeformis TaxID=6205 RepID=A0A0R3X4Y3_HYDTA|nr:unnamed protein product [Hydatigera taeniaeformis]
MVLVQSVFGIQVQPQISCGLVGSLHHVRCPEPVLPVHYQQDEKMVNLRPSSSKGTFKNFGITHLLDDPVFGEQACAAYLCAKFVPLLNQNAPILSDSRRNNALKFLKSIEKSTSEALSSGCHSRPLHNALLGFVNTVKDLAEDVSEIDELFSQKKLRRQRLKKQLPLTPPLWSTFEIPFNEDQIKAISKYLGFDGKASIGMQQELSQFSYLSCAVDPFLIALSARRVNSHFLGSGCLRVIGDINPLMLWAPPFSPNSPATPTPKIFLASFSDTTSFPLSMNQCASFRLPDKYVGSSICEIDAVPLGDSSLYLIARNTNSQIFASKTTLGLSELETLRVTKCENIAFDSSTDYYKPFSLAICPWPIHSDRSSLNSLIWALGGRAYDPVAFPNAHLAVVELFDAKLNQRLWCGRIPLSAEGECIAHVLDNSVKASSLDFVDKYYAKFEVAKRTYSNSFLYRSLLDYCQQVQEKQEGGFVSPEQLLHRAELDFKLSHASMWVRVGFADFPGLLCLTTPKRLLCLDTRISGARAAQELFNMTTEMANLDKGRLFNPYESIFHAQPHWYEDTFAFLATDYSGLILDKRMPGHPVLHWSHALRGPLAYAQICDIEDQPDDFPAQAALVMASQFPGELSVMGINFNRDVPIPPIAVGPCMTNGILTEILDCPLNNLPSGILDPRFCSERFTTSLVGLTACVLREKGGIKSVGVRGLMLTSRGDIFCENWCFSEQRAEELHRSHADEVRSWCLGFNSFNDSRSSPFRVSCVINELLNDEVRIDQKSMETTSEPFMIEDIVSESKREFTDATYPKELYSDLCQLLTSGFVSPSLSQNRRDEETKYDLFLDQVVEEAKKLKK